MMLNSFLNRGIGLAETIEFGQVLHGHVSRFKVQESRMCTNAISKCFPAGVAWHGGGDDCTQTHQPISLIKFLWLYYDAQRLFASN
ncbi:hypothetical protein MUK42_33165 [Musa troglodytarum]|uniref:Uncharacterized protein n=1 Tax=Musa troglodytarum TaxID=320322 RepID=A0A9E7FD47_9LILI|nr:hypothetical protein MUK42_33165 [Musa troglodytarum]